MAAAVAKLSDDLALKAAVSAAQRDYICEPHIGASYA